MHAEFTLDSSLVYLNHAAVAPWPLRTTRAIEQFARENLCYGAAHYPEWLETERQLRRRLARLINAPSPNDIALLKNTSEALSTVAYGIDWKPGDNLVTFQQEFPSNRVVWESLRRFGVETRLIDLAIHQIPEEAIVAACDERTRLISTSSVQYADGFRLDLSTIGEFCRREDILFCVDAIQSLGAIPFDVQACQADFVMADGHKWMLGPEGLALFYTRAAQREKLQLNQYGWHMLADYQDFEQTDWAPSPSATRFECGSPNMLGIHGLNASLSLLEEEGIEQIYRQILEVTGYLQAWIQSQPGIQLLSATDPDRRSGIVTFRVNETDQQALYRRLMAEGVICAARGGGIRFSPHFHTTKSDVDRAFEKLLVLLNHPS